MKISPPKTESFHIKIHKRRFSYFCQNIDCGYSSEPPRQGGSNECSQSMFLSRNKKNNVYPCKPQFYYIKVGLRGSKLYKHVFVMFYVDNQLFELSVFEIMRVNDCHIVQLVFIVGRPLGVFFMTAWLNSSGIFLVTWRPYTLVLYRR